MKQKTETGMVAEGTDPTKWRVPEDILSQNKGRLGRFALGFGDQVMAGKCVTMHVSPLARCRIIDLVIDEPSELSVCAITVGRLELALENGEVPASMFSVTTCSECRVARCRALVGKKWPAILPGAAATVVVQNISTAPKFVRGAFIVEEERESEEP